MDTEEHMNTYANMANYGGGKAYGSLGEYVQLRRGIIYEQTLIICQSLKGEESVETTA